MSTEYTQHVSAECGPSESIRANLASLTILERLQIDLMDGLFPERENNFQGFTRVLDIASGSGTWAVRVAREYPEIEVIGLDSQRNLVEYARGQAQAQGVDNVRFSLLENKKLRLPFPDDSFDLINAQFLFALLLTEEWPAFVSECLRVTRPGGYLRITEPEWGITNSPALERLNELFLRGLKQTGHGLSPDGRHLGIITQLYAVFEKAGYREMTRRAYASDYAMGSHLPSNPTVRAEMLTQGLQPLILEQGLASEGELAQLLQEAAQEIDREDFCGMMFFLTVCGRKPERL